MLERNGIFYACRTRQSSTAADVVAVGVTRGNIPGIAFVVFIQCKASERAPIRSDYADLLKMPASPNTVLFVATKHPMTKEPQFWQVNRKDGSVNPIVLIDRLDNKHLHVAT